MAWTAPWPARRYRYPEVRGTSCLCRSFRPQTVFILRPDVFGQWFRRSPRRVGLFRCLMRLQIPHQPGSVDARALEPTALPGPSTTLSYHQHEEAAAAKCFSEPKASRYATLCWLEVKMNSALSTF